MISKIKRLYILPGLEESAHSKAYLAISSLARLKKYKVVFIKINWKNRPRTWVDGARKILARANKSDVILGFSFGAYLVALLSSQIKTKKIIFCSISPYFSDDIKKLPKLAYKILGHKKIEELGIYKFPSLSRTPAIFMVGDKDLKIVIDRTKKSFRKWAGQKKFRLIKNAPHDIGDKNYLKEVKKNI